MTFLGPDEADNVDFAESRHKRDQDRVARVFGIYVILFICTLQRHRASVITFVQTLETAVIAEKAAREKRPQAAVRGRDAGRRREADRRKRRPNACAKA